MKNNIVKVFVILIALSSLVFLTFSVILYTSHKNWKETAAKIEAKIKPLEDQRDKLTAEKEDLLRMIDIEKSAYLKTIAALKTQAQQLDRENKDLAEKNTSLESDIRRRTDVLTANNEQIKELQATISSLSSDLASAQQSRSKYLSDLAAVIGEMHEGATTLGEVQKTNVSLKDDLEKAITVLDMKGLDPTAALYGTTTPFVVKGKVVAVKNNADKLIIVDLGADEGLKPEHQLEVYREAVYLGKVQVVTTEPHESVCKILPQYKQGEIKEGDSVSSKIK